MSRKNIGRTVANRAKVTSSVNLSGNAIGKKVTLSASDAQNIQKVTNFMVDVVRRQKRLWRKEITDWQSARFAYHQAEIPKNYPMQEVYDDVLLDGHLTGITEDLNIPPTAVGTALTTGTFAMASFVLLGAKVGAKIGVRRAFQIGLVVPALAAALIAVAQNGTMLIVAQAMSGRPLPCQFPPSP